MFNTWWNNPRNTALVLDLFILGVHVSVIFVLGDKGGWDSCFPVEGPSKKISSRPTARKIHPKTTRKSCAVWICPSALRVHQIALGQVSISGTLGRNPWVDCPTYPLIYPILDQFHPFYMIFPVTRTSRTSRRLPGACTGWDLGGEKAWRRMALGKLCHIAKFLYLV